MAAAGKLTSSFDRVREFFLKQLTTRKRVWRTSSAGVLLVQLPSAELWPPKVTGLIAGIQWAAHLDKPSCTSLVNTTGEHGY